MENLYWILMEFCRVLNVLSSKTLFEWLHGQNFDKAFTVYIDIFRTKNGMGSESETIVASAPLRRRPLMSVSIEMSGNQSKHIMPGLIWLAQTLLKTMSSSGNSPTLNSIVIIGAVQWYTHWIQTFSSRVGGAQMTLLNRRSKKLSLCYRYIAIVV